MTRFQLLLIVSLAALLPGAASGADLILRERVLPAGPVIRLGDLAEVLRATPDEEARLRSLPLMPAPAPGTQQIIRGQEVRDLLVAHGLDLMDLRFGGAHRITIGEEPKPRLVAAEPVEPAVAQPLTPPPTAQPPRRRQQSGFRLVSEAPARNGRKRTFVGSSRLESLKASLRETISEYAQQQTGDELMRVASVDLLSRNAEYLAQAIGEIRVASDSVQPGRQRFLISFESESGPIRFPVFAVVEQATPVVVATAPITRGDVITAASVRLEAFDAGQSTRLGGTPFGSVEEVIGLEAGRSIRPGQPLTEANSLPPLLVRRGEVVDVVTGGGGIRVRMTSRARRDGRLGETIEVETLDDKRRLEARVVGHRELAVLSSAGAAGYLSEAPRSRRIR